MYDGIIDITKLENAPHGFDVYRLETNRFKNICGHIYIYKVIDDEGKFYLTDDGYTLNELKRHGIKIEIGGETVDRIDDLLRDYYTYRSYRGLWEYTLYTDFCSEDDLGDEVTRFLDAIDAIYKEFLG